MPPFRADLHIHSRFSRATSKAITPALLTAWGAIKGLHVVGTGDFTHPEWRAELARSLTLDEETGLYSLSAAAHATRPINLTLPKGTIFPRFMLQAEISSIYKRGGKVRKVHSLVYMPTFEAAEKFCARLQAVGNLASDGRPILGLDARDLLEMTLETHPLAFFVPAHIWTPWFSLFGARSGFDSLEECFGDLAGEIYALETGLSSDPDMNRLWSALDSCHMVSSSDAHSGENLAREATLFSGAMTYEGMVKALRTRPGDPEASRLTTRFEGTLEFYPEEGKYHYDGHSGCGVCQSPQETQAAGNLCKVCGKPLTQGVFTRLLSLADRKEPVSPPNEPGFRSLVPLPEILAELSGTGAKTQKVACRYGKALERLGSELDILMELPTEEIARTDALLAEAVRRMRAGEVRRDSGYDGTYGRISLFSQHELAGIRARGTLQMPGGSLLTPAPPAPSSLPEEAGAIPLSETPVSAPAETVVASPSATAVPEGTSLRAAEDAKKTWRLPHAIYVGQANLMAAPGHANGGSAKNSALIPSGDAPFMAMRPALPGPDELAGASLACPNAEPEDQPFLQGRNLEQKEAIAAGPGPVLVLAGPGTGKTRTLIQRVLRLLEDGVPPQRILAVTFTRRAAHELEERLREALGAAPLPVAETLHALAFAAWRRLNDTPVLLSEKNARQLFMEVNAGNSAAFLKEAWNAIQLAREHTRKCPDAYALPYQNYEHQKSAWNQVDYTDLLEFWHVQIKSGVSPSPWTHILVDEVQDMSPLQLSILQGLLPPDGQGFFGIGDPDQSIYSFRGAHGDVLSFFQGVWPGLRVLALKKNYRSASGILTVSQKMLGIHKISGELEASVPLAADIRLFEAPGQRSEEEWIGRRIEEMLGPTSHTLLDGKAACSPGEEAFAPGDIAVIVRIKALIPALKASLERRGLPVSAPEQEAFWTDARVQMILQAAGEFLGIATGQEAQALPCPGLILTQGPKIVAAYLKETPPFDEFFWQSQEFRALCSAFESHGDWQGLLNWVNLQWEIDLVRSRSQKIQILTMHAAKGLEFRAVFLPALEEGLMPFMGLQQLAGKTAGGQNVDIDEERRLLYVAMTRARRRLYLSHARSRTLYGHELRFERSQFLGELPPELLAASTLKAHTTRRARQLSLFG